MKVSHRLYLMVTPAILGVFLTAGLAYWGQYARSAPAIVVGLGAVAVLGSLVLTWSNARYLALRIERLASGTRPSVDSEGPPDEIDAIEDVVDRLSGAVALAESSKAEREQHFEQRAHDYARLLASIADASARRLEDVRLPLHILLENRFGELNENQEEMLGAARASAEAVDADMVSLRDIAALDLGERPLRRDAMKASDLIEAIRPMLMASAKTAHVALELETAPLLPAIAGDRARLQGALVTILRDALTQAAEGSRAHLSTERDGSSVRFDLAGGGRAPTSVRWVAAVRVIQAHGGTMDHGADRLRIKLPVQAAHSGGPAQP